LVEDSTETSYPSRYLSKLTATGCRSDLSSSSKNWRAVKLPWLAMIEPGNCWMSVLYAWTLEL